jgi:hypothetical protein
MRVAIVGAAALTAEGHVMNLGDEAIADTLGAAVAEHASVSRVVTALNVRLAAGLRHPGGSAHARSRRSCARWPRHTRC